MKFRGIVRFEFAYQLRRVSTWLFFAVLGVVAFLFIRGNYISDARNGDFFLNAPWVIAAVTVLCSLLWLLVAAAVAGDAAARDVQTRMHPLTYTAPVSRAEYLGGRFLAAFILNALILLAVPAGILLALYSPGVESEILGPFRPAAYLTAYAFISLPNAFVATAIQFSLATLNRRAMASYLGSVLLFVTAYIVAGAVANPLHMPRLGKLLDPIGVITVVGYVSKAWTTIEKNTRLIELYGLLLWNRLFWLVIAVGTLAFTHFRFRFINPAAGAWRSRTSQRRDANSPSDAVAGMVGNTSISIPRVRRTFGFATHARQTLAIAWRSFRKIVKVRGGPVLVTALAMISILSVPELMKFMGVPLFPRTEHVIFFTVQNSVWESIWVIIPLLTILYAGELVWWERDAGLGEIAGAAPVPEWVLLVGKFLGLSLVFVAWLALLMTVGVLAQVRMGSTHFEIGLYLQILFGLQLTDYLLFALLALVVHAVVNQKHIGHLVAFIAYGVIAYGSALGIEHNLLVFGSDPGWSYTDMRGFGPFIGPWLWFKVYWAAWALLLAVVARLLWVRGRGQSLGKRLHLARRRFTRPTAWTAAAAVGLILTLGGFIFYNTNVLNRYYTASDRLERSAEYEHRYKRYEGIPQPWLTGTSLNVDIYPERRAVDIDGTYRLVNNGAVPIDSVHLATISEVETGEVDFDRSAVRVFADEDLGHWIYTLEEPLQPGDSLRLNFEVHVEPHGFSNRGVDAFVVANGAYFTNQDWLPAIGYQPNRELRNAGDRRAHGLAPRPVPSPFDVEANQDGIAAERIAFEAVVGTDENQVAVAPGALRRTWTEGERRYFHYSTGAPIGNEYAFFSSDYAVREGQWNPSTGSGQVVSIEIFHHPGHITNLDRMVRSVQASLSHYTEQFGPYPYSHIRLIERPGHGYGMHADAIDIAYDEGFSLLNPEDGPRGLDLPFYVVAHEVAHQWWGAQLTPAYAEGAGLLIESLASYSAYQVVENTYGPEHLRRLFGQLRMAYEVPRTRAAVPLLRANDPFLYYRKGPFALFALSRYVGEERVNGALRRLLAAHASGAPPLPTSLDLFRELQAVTPDSLQYLLHDLFEANTFWELRTERATAEKTDAGTWQVKFDVRARKVVVDSAGFETPVLMDDWVEIGVFAPNDEGNGLGEPIYLQKHRIHSTEQTITVTVPSKPARVGVDPYHLLIDLEMADNIKDMKIKG